MKINSETMYLFDNGHLLEAYKHFGAHLVKDSSGKSLGVRFTVYAPNARICSVVGNFNHWDSRIHTMEKIDAAGVYSIYIDGIGEWERYKYCIVTQQGETLFKADPFAFYSDFRPETSSKVYDLDGYEWKDHVYMDARKNRCFDQEPMNIYEMHMGSWMRKPDGQFNSFNEIADLLINHLKNHGFTHVEFLPLAEHPLDESWGYQATGYYSATSRFGVPKDLCYLIDRLHQEGLGIILDWVPSHICKDSHGLYQFDGSFLYEYEDESIRENIVWGTINLDLSKGQVRSFLLSNARFWMDYFHIDGFRIDAVSNILYYLGDPSRGVNEGALDFLKQCSQTVKAYDSSVLLFAEDSSTFPKLTAPVEQGGVGFDYKWNMGWMNDTLRYFEKDPIYRKYHHHLINFAMVYHYSEHFVLALSHDEVVHGKKSLVEKMPGGYWQKFANYRLLMGLQMTHPGKKLTFMGNEFGHMHEWRDSSELDWHLFEYPMHQKANQFYKDLSKMYLECPCFYEKDFDPDGFQWVDSNNSEQSIYSFLRFDRSGNFCLVVLNMTPMVYHHYRLGVPEKGVYHEILNSDLAKYEGSNIYNGLDPVTQDVEAHGFKQSIQFVVSPLAIQVFKLRK